MATGEPEPSSTLSRVISSSSDTIFRNIDLQKVGPKLTTGEKLPTKLKKQIKFAMKMKDKRIFLGAVVAMDLKSLLIFLEVLDEIQDDKHRHIVTHLCSGLQHYSLKSESDQEVVDRLQYFKAKYLPKSVVATRTAMDESMAPETSISDETTATEGQESLLAEDMSQCTLSKPVWYYEHPVETAMFSSGVHNEFYSPVHDVAVIMEPGAFPQHLSRLTLSLTVNDYSHRISLPQDYRGMYSALLSLKCDPPVEKFPKPVAVTVPHCALGALDNLCVLVGEEGDNTLHEDSDVEIESVDQLHLTFRALHFTNHMVAESICPKRRLKAKKKWKQFTGAVVGTQSFDETLVRSGSASGTISMPIPRSHSCPSSSRTPVHRFVAVMFTPRDTSCAHWKFVLMVTYHLRSFDRVSSR